MKFVIYDNDSYVRFFDMNQRLIQFSPLPEEAIVLTEEQACKVVKKLGFLASDSFELQAIQQL